MKFIYLILFLNILDVSGQFAERMNWTFAELPTRTLSQRRYKCSQKLDFSCECRASSTMYDVGTVEDIHPFCLTEEGKNHGACTGGCIDVNYNNVIDTQINGRVINIKAECDGITKEWTPPVYPKCLNQNNEDVYAINGGQSCNTQAKCNTFAVCKRSGSCADNPNTVGIDEGCVDAPRWRTNGVPNGQDFIPGICRMAGEAEGSIVDVTSAYPTEEACTTPFTWVPAMNRVKKYYEISKATEIDNGGGTTTLQFEENEHRQCLAGDDTKEKYGIDECPKNDPYCNQFPLLDRIDIDNDNYNQMILSASFTKYGKLRRCDSRGKVHERSGKYDNQLYPLAPCPDVDVPYYCDYPQNQFFGNTLNGTVIDTTCGVGKYDNQTRNSMGLPHGIRAYENGFDMQSFQWSVEQEDSVSLAKNMNEVLTEFETVQMNIYSIGKLIDRKYILTSHQEGLDEAFINKDNAKELGIFFEKLALTGDSLPFSTLQSEEEVRAAAEWSPTDLHATGETNQLRCHSVDDSTITNFRAITDVRRDFVDKFFEVGEQQDCNGFGYATLDTLDPNATKFKRCATTPEKESSFLYPSTRKAFVNPVKADFFLSGFMKGSRFIKEMGISEETVGFVSAGERKMVDGTNVPQNASFDHIKMMFSLSTDQAENCNTVRGSCRPTYHEYPNYRFYVDNTAIIEDIVEGSTVNATSFAYCKGKCLNNIDCGGFMYKARSGLHQCKIIHKSGETASSGQYTDLQNTLLADDAANHWTAVTLKRPDCTYKILNTRFIDVEVEEDGSFEDKATHNDGILNMWGMGEDKDKGKNWGYHTCRTSITVKKMEKIDADKVALGLRNTVGEFFTDEYPYTITIDDEGCQDHVIHKDEVVSQATTAAVSLTEAEEIIKIHSPTSPAYCRSTNGHYSGNPIDAKYGGVCLSHKQKPRHAFGGNKPFGDIEELDATCMDGVVDKIDLFPNKKACVKEGFQWTEGKSFIHTGAAETCFVNGVYKTHEFETKETCEAETGGVWTDAIPATSAFGYVSSADGKLLERQCVAVTADETACATDSYAQWNSVINKCYYPFVISQFDCDMATNAKISLAVAWSDFYTPSTVPLSYEDERLTCGGLGIGEKDINGAYTSRYDRIRMILFLDVLRLKDLYNEGKGASTIVPRGLPIGLTEGHTPIGGFKDPQTNVYDVGQHRLEINDQDVAYYNPDTKQECTVKEAANVSTGCLTYSYATGYRANGRGETFRGRTDQERQDRNQIRKVIGKYLVRDEGVDEASPDSLGQPFWKDELTTISFLGTATSTDLPLEVAVQDIREDYGDAKVYNRYMVELFSDCKDRTKQQQHSSRLHFQIFKEGRLHGDRIKDSLTEVDAGDFNAGFTKYDIATSSANGKITLPEDIGQPLNSNDLVTLHDCPDAGNYMLKSAGYEQDTSVTQVISGVAGAGMKLCEATTLTPVDSNSVQECAEDAHAASKVAFSYNPDLNKCTFCDTNVGVTAASGSSSFYTVKVESVTTLLDTFTYNAEVVAFPDVPHTIGAAITKTLDNSCKISLMERDCSGFFYDVKTSDLLARASPIHSQFQITTKDVCGPVELSQLNCGSDPSLWGDEGVCLEDGVQTTRFEMDNEYACITNGLTWQQNCNYLRPCGPDTPPGFPKTCSLPSNSRCQICNADTPTCYDADRGDLHPDGKLVARTKSVDMKCAGFDFTNRNIKLGMTTKKVIDTLSDSIDNLDFIDLPVETQTYGSVFGAELVEFSVGFNILDTIKFEDEQYLLMEGMGTARTEAIAWLKNNRIGEQLSVKDVRSMADLTYPQLTTEEVIFTAQSYDPNLDPELHNLHIETLSVCAHEKLTYFEPFIALGKIERNVVNCLVGKVNDGRDAYGNILVLGDGSPDPKYAVGTDACQYVHEICPHKPMTGFSLKKEDTSYFLLADYRPLYGQSGHQFIDNTCDILSITRLLDLLTLPDFQNEYDNNMVYQFATNLPEKCTTDNDGVQTCALSGDEAVKQACVHVGTDDENTAQLRPEDFFKKLGPKGNQVPVSQTIVRNFKSMMMKEAKELMRGVREVVPCRRLATHGDNLSPQFADTILYGYNTGFGSLSEFGDRYEPRNCWHDSFESTCMNASYVDVTDTYDSGSKCRTPSEISTRATVDLVPKKCEPFYKGIYNGNPTAIQLSDNFVDRFNLGGAAASWSLSQCHQLCEDHQHTHCAWNEGLTTGMGACYFIGGVNPSVEADASSPFYVASCEQDTSNMPTSGSGYFSVNTVEIATNVNIDNSKTAKEVCATDATCIGFHETPVEATEIYCDNNIQSSFKVLISRQDETANPLVIQEKEECMFQCKGVLLSGTASTHIKFEKGVECICKQKADAAVCAAESNVLSPILMTNHYEIDVAYNLDSNNDPTNIRVNRQTEFTLFSYIDAYGIESSNVLSKSSTFYVRPIGSCIWCTWDNTNPKTYEDDSETCLTNVLDHLQNSESFENYLDNIGPALDMEKEICVQKNNIYRSPGSKHIACGYNNLYNFDMDSVYPPDSFELTDEEIAYRLNPQIPSWDALIFHPDDIGDIANHYEPITKNFILPIKAEIVVQGHNCHDDYDFAAASKSALRRRRRRMLGKRRRKRVGRKLLQEDGQGTSQFGSVDGVAFNIEFKLGSTSTVPISTGPIEVDGRIVYPGDASYPETAPTPVVETPKITPGNLLNTTNTTIIEENEDCINSAQNLLLLLTYGSYYGIVLIVSLIALIPGVALRLNKFE